MRIRYFPGCSYDTVTCTLCIEVRTAAASVGLDVVGMSEKEIADALVDNLVWGSAEDETAFGLVSEDREA